MSKKNLLSFCLITGLLFLLIIPAFGATVTVINTNDSGAGSLRQVITAAAAGDTVDFSITGTITLTTGEITIAKNLTISGPGAGSLTISGNNNSRIFYINAAGATVNMSGVTLSQGNSASWGGAIENEGNLSLTDCIIDSCIANGAGNGYGGGIDNYNGTVNITRCTISNNTANNNGGGVATYGGTITITESTIRDNTSDLGGGISNYSNAGGTVNVIRSTIHTNHATGGGSNVGGGIHSDGGSLTVNNSTISGNDAVNGGGGIVDGAFCAMTIVQATITGNTSTTGGGGIDLGNTTANIKNTILAGNTGGGSNNFYNNGAGALNSQGYNLSDDAVAAFVALGDQQNATPGLDPLADNGGPTHTHKLQPVSDAVDAIPEGGNSYNGAPPTDQRGTARPQGTNVDAGAYELLQVPILTTQAVSAIATNTATGNGTITNLGSTNPTARGMVWNTTGNPTLADNSSNEGGTSSTGAFTSSMTGLSPFTTYYVKAYATNSVGTGYGNEVSFATLGILPSVTTQAVTGIASTTATGNGNITSLGVPNPIAHGMVWNTTGNPTLADNSSNEGAAAATGAFTSNMIGLLPYTTYYVKAYATNAAGTVYGNEVSFSSNPVAPTVTTQPATGITTNSAVGNGNITNLGVPNPAAHGMVWNTTGNPTLADNSSNEGATAATGAFTSNMIGLSAGVTYYVKAYATNAAGTVYGSQVSFTTTTQAPTVTTQPATSITTNSAVGHGNITSLGAPPPTAHGMVWNTTGSPTLADNSSNEGATAVTGAFTSNIIGLSAGVTYYVKAYATNAAGTAYGNEVTFTAATQLPTVTTQAATSITTNSAVGNGNITSLGAPNPTAHGVVWNTAGNPTLADNSTNEGAAAATGAFTSNMIGLSAGVTYYVKAYATNAAGTVYGNQVSFTAGTQLPTVTTQAANSITTNSAVGNGNITSLGAPNPTAHGMVWNTTGSPTLADNFSDEGAAGATGAFTSNITSLAAGVTYYVKAYATNAAGTVYGSQVSFTTLTQLPTVTTQATTSIGTISATGNGNITSLGAPNPTSHGMVWNTAGSPTLADSSSNEGTAAATGAFTSNMTGLVPGVTYYARAYATNLAGTSYGAEVSFTTITVPPTVTTQGVTGITSTAATGNGNITSLGAPNPTAHGMVWNTTGSPTLADSFTDEGAVASTGNFSSVITGLSPDTTYYVRAYATNAAGTAYGGEVSFTTLPAFATVSTADVTSITATSAICGGTVTDDGGSTVTARGVCWSTSTRPTVKDSYTEDGTGLGSFVSYLTDLTPNTTYYARAYATTAAGTAYGKEKTFTTLEQIAPPTVTITEPADGAYVTGIVTIQAQAQGEQGVEKVEFFVDQETIGEGQLTQSNNTLQFDCSDARIFFIDAFGKLKKIDNLGNIRPVLTPALAIDNIWTTGDGYLYVSFEQPQRLQVVDSTEKSFTIVQLDPRDGSYSGIASHSESREEPGIETTIEQLLQNQDNLSLPLEWIAQYTGGGLYAGYGAQVYQIEKKNSQIIEISPQNLTAEIMDDIKRIAAIAAYPIIEVPGKKQIKRRENPGLYHFIIMDQQVLTSPPGSYQTVQTYSIDWHTSSSTYGEHTIRALAYDALGQTGEDSIQVTIPSITLGLSASRETEKAWLVSRIYGKLTIQIDNPSNVPVNQYIIYKQVAGTNEGFQELGQFTANDIPNGTYTYYDKYLEKDQTVTYKVVAVDISTNTIAISEEITI